jgi:chromatin modification-related protein VID21
VIFVVLTSGSAIVASRKRKLRELFAVATHAEGLPHDGFSKPDAPPSTQAELDFLQGNDILQGKRFNEQFVPGRPAIHLDALRSSLALLGYGTTPPPPKPPPSTTNKEAQRLKSTPNSTPDTKREPQLAPAQLAQPPAPVPSLTPTEARPTPPVTHVPLPKQVTSSQAIATEKPRIDQKPSLPNVTQPAPTATIPNTAPRPHPQVSFEPATKFAPLPVPNGETTTSAADEKDADQPATTKQPIGALPPPLKVPAEVPRVSDALSSPGSTAPSATTPGGVHERSTDTSPDNEGPAYPEAEKKENQDGRLDATGDKLAGASKASPAVDETAEEPPASAEAQLLQESSTAAVSSGAILDSSSAKPFAQDTVPTSTTKPSPVEAPRQSAEKEQLEAADTSELPQDHEEGRPDVTQSVEIPDSREETPDRMDVDIPEPVKETQADKVESAKAPDAIPPEASVTPSVEKALPQESSQGVERAVTRVSSGALKPKSVNEIVGGASRSPTSTHQPLAAKEQQVDEQLTPITSTPQSPTSRPRRISSGRKDKPKGHVSAVLFGKQPKRPEDSAMVSGSKEAIHPSDDYYTPLFVQGFAGSSSWMQPMEKVLFHANKTVATPDVNLCIQDHQACKVLRRVYHLQSNDKWSLRQPKRAAEPTRPPSHWDVVLQEAKWMRADFREERKWKMAAARRLANACADWCASSPDERRAMQVDAFIPPKPATSDDLGASNGLENGVDSQPTPDLVPGDTESPQALDELVDMFHETVPPSTIFTLQDDDVVFGLRRTPAADQLLEELPIFGAPLKVPRPDLVAPDYDPDAHWRRPALPLSKYVEGHMKLASNGPPRKRSRFNYRNEDSDDDDDRQVGFSNDIRSQNVQLPPESGDVALFNPEMKHIRDRLHAGHQFRPPTDHPMPAQSFYECRNPSMWTHTEDDELRSLVREYSYNWPLISSMLQSKSIFSSGAERRTPWECFERWIQLEGLPSDMQKTQYFRAYNSRIDAAQRVIAQQNQLAAQQASASGGSAPPMRRRQSLPLRVERRRQQKHLTLMDAMRKLAKKREAAIQKQQHTATQNAANKKPDAVTQAQRSGPGKTPRDYSILRWERDQALAEKMAAFAHRQDATRRAAIVQARAQSQGQGQQRAQGAGGPVVQNGHAAAAQPNGANGMPRPNGAAQAAAMGNQPRARMPMAPPGQAGNGINNAGGPQLPSGLVPPVAMNGGGTPQAQMQAAQHRMQMPSQQQPNAAMMMRAQQISEQQRAAQQMQQAQHQHPHQQLQQHPHQQGGAATPRPTSQHNSPPNMVNGVAGVNGINGINQQSYMNNAQAIIAQFNGANGGHNSPPANMHMAAGSPRPMSQMQIPPALANQINHIEAQFRAKNPNLTPEQARQYATEHLARAMAAQRHSAMNAAAGGTGQHGIANSIAATTSPHQYAALLRQQQQQQQQQAAQQAQQQQSPHPQQLQQTASQAASSPGQVSQTSHQRQSSEGATPSAV